MQTRKPYIIPEGGVIKLRVREILITDRTPCPQELNIQDDEQYLDEKDDDMLKKNEIENTYTPMKEI